VEQDAEDWWRACIAAVRQAVSPENRSKVTALSLSTQGASMLALDGEGMPMGRAFTWMDSRAQAEADQLEARLGGDGIYRTTGWRVAPYLDAAKILYMKTHREYERAVMYLSTIEYINLKLTGVPVIDPTNAAIRQLYNINTRKWDEKILNAAGVSEGELPVLLKTGQLVGELGAQASDDLGLRPGVKVYNGAHDQYCASIGCGAVNVGDLLISTGTTWVVMGISEKPVYSKTFIVPCPHPTPGLYGNMISLSGAGSSYQWMADTFFPGRDLARIDEELPRRIEKNRGLFFVPWLSGAAYPFWNSSARGGFVGMDFAAGPYDMALAVMESAAFSLKNALCDLEENGLNPSAIKIMGGAAKSGVWMDMVTALIDVPVYKMRITDSCALGAAFIAACGEGWYGDYGAAAKETVAFEKTGGTRFFRNFYQEKFRRYTEMLAGMDRLFQKEGVG
jgi:sugar (pentulose or hexulose) kinase